MVFTYSMPRHSGCAMTWEQLPSCSSATHTFATLCRVASLKRSVRHSCLTLLAATAGDRGSCRAAACAVTLTVPLPCWDCAAKTVTPSSLPQPLPWLPIHSGACSQAPGSEAWARCSLPCLAAAWLCLILVSLVLMCCLFCPAAWKPLRASALPVLSLLAHKLRADSAILPDMISMACLHRR
jgi:hypothetical protein